MTIKDIEGAVKQLHQQELALFRAWFYKFDAQLWDKQFEKDAHSGKLDRIAEEAIRDFKHDRCRPL